MRFPYHHQVVANATINTVGTSVVGQPFQNFSKAQKPVILIYLRIANAPTGTSPSLTISLSGSQDQTNWASIPSGAFASQTSATGAATVLRLAVTDVIDPWLQIQAQVSGTTPSFTGVSIDVYISTEE